MREPGFDQFNPDDENDQFEPGEREEGVNIAISIIAIGLIIIAGLTMLFQVYKP